jgi:hypothetical protein
MTRDQFNTCIALNSEGFITLPLPGDAIPGHVVMAGPDGRELVLIQGDGTVVDLIEVHRLAEDTVRNWQKDSPLPHFVGDFGRLTKLTQALNGRKPPGLPTCANPQTDPPEAS